MSAWGWHWHCLKCHQTITDLNKDAHLGTCSAPRSPSSSKPVNCPECGRFEGHYRRKTTITLPTLKFMKGDPP